MPSSSLPSAASAAPLQVVHYKKFEHYRKPSRSIQEAEREHATKRPPPSPQDFSTRRLLFTIAITEIPFLLGLTS
ncbi:hypothetical protein L1887_41765 [Cichorium endivia]|nr:hypothetical protein L1887_41765 [Cichorium endivia]